MHMMQSSGSDRCNPLTRHGRPAVLHEAMPLRKVDIPSCFRDQLTALASCKPRLSVQLAKGAVPWLGLWRKAAA